MNKLDVLNFYYLLTYMRNQKSHCLHLEKIQLYYKKFFSLQQQIVKIENEINPLEFFNQKYVWKHQNIEMPLDQVIENDIIFNEK